MLRVTVSPGDFTDRIRRFRLEYFRTSKSRIQRVASLIRNMQCVKNIYELERMGVTFILRNVWLQRTLFLVLSLSLFVIVIAISRL